MQSHLSPAGRRLEGCNLHLKGGTWGGESPDPGGAGQGAGSTKVLLVLSPCVGLGGVEGEDQVVVLLDLHPVLSDLVVHVGEEDPGAVGLQHGGRLNHHRQSRVKTCDRHFLTIHCQFDPVVLDGSSFVLFGGERVHDDVHAVDQLVVDVMALDVLPGHHQGDDHRNIGACAEMYYRRPDVSCYFYCLLDGGSL